MGECNVTVDVDSDCGFVGVRKNRIHGSGSVSIINDGVGRVVLSGG